MEDFDYLGEGEVYLDGACQSLRPRPVIDAISKYYTEHNSCGERVKYKWGRITDEKVEETREKVLKFLKLKPKKYTVSFTLNTTYGINLLLNQLTPEMFKKIMTSEIEHNSPFLASLAFSERTGLPREVMKRNEDGSIPHGYLHFPEYNTEYFKQLTAEQLVTKIVKGYPKREWQKTRDRNEALDCRIYARAAAIALGIDRWTDAKWEQIAETKEKVENSNSPKKKSKPKVIKSRWI